MKFPSSYDLRCPPPLVLPVVICVQITFEFELLGSRQREVFLAPAPAGLKLMSSGRKRLENETYSTARQHSTKPEVKSCNDLTGH
ncbi:hypothetical protein GOODEAATRI_030147 [Goodea atripinnis]|uniref:Uncharacterized protein n=1 Tax=Goodea atripinnis TaxID=208336 RepID=A0ABV0PID2_9TELE